MAFDKHDDDGGDGPNDVKPERHQWHGGSGGDTPAPRAEPAEVRTRAECYEALRAADGKPVPASDSQRAGSDTRGDHAGWDAVDAGNRPPLDALRVTPERTKHILDGDATDSGGHRHGVGKPGKTEFPASWNDKKIMDNILDVARWPDQPPIHQNWNDRWLARGTRDDVEIAVVITSDGLIWSGWPRLGGPGVVKNPQES
jgi:Bacterial EndoU nuclease